MTRMRETILRLLPCLLLLCALPGPALAADPVPDKDGFVAESRPADMTKARVDESVPAVPLVAGAYGFIWTAVLVYVGTVAMRARRLEDELAALQRQLGHKGA